MIFWLPVIMLAQLTFYVVISTTCFYRPSTYKQTVLSCHGIAQVDREKQINFAMDQSTLIGILIVPVLN